MKVFTPRLFGPTVLSSLLVLTLSSGASSQEATEPVTVEIMSTLLSPEVGPPPADWFWTQAVKDALNIDVEVSWVDGSDYATLLTTRAGANNLPDLFVLRPSDIVQLAPQGLLADWTPYLDAMPSYAEVHNVAELAPIGSFDGQQLGLVTGNTFPYKAMVSIRRDWLQKLGLEVPQTTEEFLAVMKAFTEGDPDGNGRDDTYGWSGFVNDDGSLGGFDPFFGAFGALGGWRVADGQLVSLTTGAETRSALEFINRMVQEGVVDPDWQTQRSDDLRAKWKAGRIGIFVDDWYGTYCPGNFDPFAEVNPTGELVVIDPPVGPDGASAGGLYTGLGTIYGMSQRAADAGKGEAIARLLEWLATDGYYLSAYGQEGLCWERGEDGGISQDNENTCRTLKQLAAWAYGGSPEELLARYATVTEHVNGQTIDVGAIVERSETYPRVDTTAFAVIPPPSPVVAADLQRTVAENQLQLVLGQKPFAEWDQYVATLEGIGLGQYVAEANQIAAENGMLE